MNQPVVCFMCYKKAGRGRALIRCRKAISIVLPPALVRAGPVGLPALIRDRGERASHRLIDFFTASIRNRNTRTAYACAVKRFFDLWDERRLEPREIEAITVAAYIEETQHRTAKPTVKQHLAAN